MPLRYGDGLQGYSQIIPGGGSFGVSGGIKGVLPELIESAVNIRRGAIIQEVQDACQSAGGPCRFRRDAPQYGNDRRAGALPKEETIALGS